MKDYETRELTPGEARRRRMAAVRQFEGTRTYGEAIRALSHVTAAECMNKALKTDIRELDPGASLAIFAIAQLFGASVQRVLCDLDDELSLIRGEWDIG